MDADQERLFKAMGFSESQQKHILLCERFKTEIYKFVSDFLEKNNDFTIDALMAVMTTALLDFAILDGYSKERIQAKFKGASDIFYDTR